MKEKNNWYSVRCLFKYKKRKDMSKKYLYEERITLWYTESIDKAIELAEKEAKDYEADDCKYLRLAQGFWIYEKPESGEEIFSLMRESDLPKNKYLDSFFDTGLERQQDYAA